ncbi:pyruvate kinase [Salinilacustrithrix flava]|uniref:pyruvate kinase n=1 Tax=Salinilacustrithrix flava TaxID=2957203 RepID=UPI003D7C2EB5
MEDGGDQDEELEDLIAELDALDAMVRAAGEEISLEHIHPEQRVSAQNMARYLALRSQDVRGLQHRLAELGLSSLGRAEAHVAATLHAVRRTLRALADVPLPDDVPPPPAFAAGWAQLRDNSVLLLGPEQEHRPTRIMVTLPSEAADDPDLVMDLVRRGMDIARINCAHDERERWERMALHVRRAADRTGREVRVLMDLAGPKLRTGSIEPGPPVLRVRPRRNAYGRPVAPGQALLLADPTVEPDTELAVIPVADADLDLAGRTEISLVDARGATRRAIVSARLDHGCIVDVWRTTWFTEGSELRADGRRVGTVVDLPRAERAHLLRTGDRLRLVEDLEPAQALDDPAPGWIPEIGCTLPEALTALHPGDRVLFDDGTIRTEVESVDQRGVLLRVTFTRPGGRRLRGGKGINLPDTPLPVTATTEKDIEDLPVIAELGDVVALSFVRRPDDVSALLDRLDEIGSDLGVVLKIETVAAFEALPELLRTAMRRPVVGVMIARGDLAVEAGWIRLAEVQEEILWLCESAHVPVIWATQVLETLAKTGQASRSEITDAAMSERAECVMLNKGPYVGAAVTALDDILARMGSHQHKKLSLLRRLQAWSQTDG